MCSQLKVDKVMVRRRVWKKLVFQDLVLPQRRTRINVSVLKNSNAEKFCFSPHSTKNYSSCQPWFEFLKEKACKSCERTALRLYPVFYSFPGWIVKNNKKIHKRYLEMPLKTEASYNPTICFLIYEINYSLALKSVGESNHCKKRYYFCVEI